MKSLWNPNRFLRSIKQWYWGNPQPGKVFSRRMVARCFTSTNNARRKVHPHKITFLRSWPQ
jgi:hypothetical protein